MLTLPSVSAYTGLRKTKSRHFSIEKWLRTSEDAWETNSPEFVNTPTQCNTLRTRESSSPRHPCLLVGNCSSVAKIGCTSAIKTKVFDFRFVLRSPYLCSLRREDWLHLSNKNESFWTFVLYCVRFALSLQKFWCDANKGCCFCSENTHTS